MQLPFANMSPPSSSSDNQSQSPQSASKSSPPLPTDVPGGEEILKEVTGKHANSSVVMHGLYGIYFKRKSIRYMARMLGKSPSTVHRWVKRWESDRLSGRIQKDPQYRKFDSEHRAWIKDYYEKYPLTFIDETANAFEEHFNMTISCSHVWAILMEAGFTRKVRLCYICS